MAKAITKKPDTIVGKLGIPARATSGNTYNISSSWTITDWQKHENNVARAEKVRVKWQFSKKVASWKNFPTLTIDGNTSLTSSMIDFSNKKFGTTTYTRNSFYPVTSWKVYSLWISVQLGNSKGWGPVATQSRKFLPPRVPTLGQWSFNKDNGVATINIKTNAGTDAYERYDTRYILEVENTRTGAKYNHVNTSSRSTDFNVSFNVGDYQQLTYGQYIKLTLTAWARGYAGDSNKISRTVYVSYPAQTTITRTSVSSRDATGKCTAYVQTNSTAEHPVDYVKLEYLANVEYDTQESIPGDANWSDSGIQDDANCSALSMSVSNLLPDKGKYTWLRVKSYHLVEEVLYRYSKAERLEALETPAPTVTDDKITIISAHAGSDGNSAVVFLGWNRDGLDDATGTELTWSDEEDTWKSTKKPEEYEFTWSDGPVTAEVDGQLVYFHDSATIVIKGLAEGETYYIKARRYLEGDTTTYSDYSNIATVITSERPESIVATCNRYVAEGDALSVKWTFSGNGIQREWQIVAASDKYIPTKDAIAYVATSDTAIVAGKTYYTRSAQGEYSAVSNPVVSEIGSYYEKVGGVASGKTYYTRSGTEGSYVYTAVATPTEEDLDNYFEVSTGGVIASGETSIGATQIAYDRLKTFAENGNVSFVVQASTGSGFVTSEELRVSMIDNPQLSIDVSDTLTAQPFSFEATSNRLCNLIVVVKSQGITGQYPQGVLIQTSGDTVHSDVYVPEWQGEQAPFTTVVELPSDLDFRDTGMYTISVVGIDRATDLKSEEQTADFGIEWSHQAVDPYDAVTVTPIDTVDANGIHHIAAEIVLTPPTGSAETDVYDIYRMDGGRAQLIGESFPLSVTTVDEYAPFGEDMDLYYRVAIRTIDGDVNFCDKDYRMGCKSLRLDWPEGFLELLYDISIGDSYKKDVEVRRHLDGSIEGYWNEGIERKGSLSSSVIRVVQPDDVDKARVLARYTGPVFVRTPNGSAYEADVQVTDLSVKNKAITAVALDATEISITREFQLPPPIIEEGD